VIIKFNRAISTGQLNKLLHLHFQPINVIVYYGTDRDN
jgi:hypothetical protein